MNSFMVLTLRRLALLVTVSAAGMSFTASAQQGDAADPSGLKELAEKLPAVTEVIGNAMQVAQYCGLSAMDMQGTQHAYFTILSTATAVASLRSVSPEIKKLWPTEADFRAAYQRGQESARKNGVPTAEVCAQARVKFPTIDEREERASHTLAAKLSTLQINDDRTAEARIKAGLSPLDKP